MRESADIASVRTRIRHYVVVCRAWVVQRWRAVCLIVLVLLISSQVERAETNSATGISLPTDFRLQSSKWWPTQGKAEEADYAGSEACKKCHQYIANEQAKTAMAQASTRASNSRILASHPSMAFNLPPYVYKTSGASLVVQQGANSRSTELLWAFGMGRMGQTYIFEREGKFYEGHLSFFAALDGLDITPGHPRTVPATIEDGMGRPLESSELRECFACHTSRSTLKDRFDR